MEKKIPGIDNEHRTPFKFDVFTMDEGFLAGVRKGDGKSFYSPDFADKEEYKPLCSNDKTGQ